MFLCIDLGSTSFKASVYDAALTLKGSGSAYLEYAQLGERVELLPETICEAVQQTTKDALNDAQIEPQSVTAVAITSQAQTFALRDETGFRTPFISWQDRRAVAIAEAMKKSQDLSDFALHSSFNEPLAGQMICLLQAVFDEDPELRESAVIPLPAFVIEQLTGTLVMDDNLAAMTGLWSLPAGQWHAPYLKKTGITEHQLPHIAPLPAPAGTVQPGNALSLPIGCPVFSAGNDQTAGAFAAELERDGGMLITLGSAQVVYQWVPQLPDAEPGLIRGVYPGGGYYRMIADSTGGSLILRAVQQLGLAGFPEFFALAEAGFGHNTDLPETLPESETIRWSDESATLELQCASVLDYLSKRMAGFVKHLRRNHDPLFLTDGGGARNAVWKECLESKLEQLLPLRSAAPARGAARMLVSLGS